MRHQVLNRESLGNHEQHKSIKTDQNCDVLHWNSPHGHQQDFWVQHSELHRLHFKQKSHGFSLNALPGNVQVLLSHCHLPLFCPDACGASKVLKKNTSSLSFETVCKNFVHYILDSWVDADVVSLLLKTNHSVYSLDLCLYIFVNVDSHLVAFLPFCAFVRGSVLTSEQTHSVS